MNTLIDFSSLIIQSINFAVVGYVLHRFFFVPYLSYIDTETTNRKKMLEQIANSEKILSDAKDEAERIENQSRLDAKIIATEIQELARKDAADIVARAQIDADAKRSKGFADVALERKSMENEMKKRVLDVALKLNEKIFGKSEAHTDFIRKQAPDIQF
jgi:F-type H+-transporting ATPase subunit b